VFFVQLLLTIGAASTEGFAIGGWGQLIERFWQDENMGLSVHSFLLESFPRQRSAFDAVQERRPKLGMGTPHLVAIAAILLALSTIGIYGAYKVSEIELSLLPADEAEMPWTISATSDRQEGGESSVKVRDDRERIDFDFTIVDSPKVPYVAVSALFSDPAVMEDFVDWSSYGSISIDVRCDPSSEFMWVLSTFDEKVTRIGDYSSLRISSAFFSCENTTKSIDIDLRHLKVPTWWLLHQGQPLTDRAYNLSKVLGFSFINSQQSPRGVLSNLSVSNIRLYGRNWASFYAAVVGCAVIWVLFLTFAVKLKLQKVREDIREKSQQERTLVPYQEVPNQLSGDLHKDAIFRYMATQYVRPDLSLEVAVAELSINRSKINAILKEELGLTFVGYINKLRLTEAARLLTEKESSVAEIAYLVGYSNASYFTTVFKKEHGCTPVEYRKQVVCEDA
jgi:AraC-like DNA-binding protein